MYALKSFAMCTFCINSFLLKQKQEKMENKVGTIEKYFNDKFSKDLDKNNQQEQSETNEIDSNQIHRQSTFTKLFLKSLNGVYSQPFPFMPEKYPSDLQKKKYKRSEMRRVRDLCQNVDDSNYNSFVLKIQKEFQAIPDIFQYNEKIVAPPTKNDPVFL